MKKITIDSQEQFPFSPYLYMQFMEPLGATDGSVEAGWDHQTCAWRDDLVKVISELSPPMIRWGGCFSSYYRWKEGIGPRETRTPMLNLLWGGIESNQIGTHEFMNLCRSVKAEPLVCVNFESDGRMKWAEPVRGGKRSAGPEEAADWVSFCNDPDNRERARNGSPDPFQVTYWQIGNETSYSPEGYDVETAGRRTAAFASAMRERDPDIKLIAWGDSGWAMRMAEIAGEKIDYLAFHHMIRPECDPDSPVRGEANPISGIRFRCDEARSWEYLMRIHEIAETKIERIRSELGGYRIPIIKTEGHFAIDGRNRGEVLATWAAGVSNARIFHVHERHGDILHGAVGTDFFGTRWLVNSILIPVPSGQSYLLPVGAVMKLYRRYLGAMCVRVSGHPTELDITAGKTGSDYILHIINTDMINHTRVSFEIPGRKIDTATVHTIACDPFTDVEELGPDALEPVSTVYTSGEDLEFAPASVSALVFTTSSASAGE